MPELDASAAAVLAATRAAALPPIHELTPEQLLAGHIANSPAMAGPGEAVAEVVDLEVAGVPVRRYTPAGAGQGTVIYAHGGGWVVGTLDTYDTLCRALANRSGLTIVSVGYTLAPEAQHPFQVEEVAAVLRAFAADRGPLALAGDSAGGHLAALVAAGAPGDGVELCALALVYPCVSPSLDTASYAEVGTGYLLGTEAMRWYWNHYLGPDPVEDPPTDLLRLDLSVLPPTLVLTAGFDPLRDEGRLLAEAASSAGVPVEHIFYPGQMHGFFRTTAQIPEALQAVGQVGAFLAKTVAAAR